MSMQFVTEIKNPSLISGTLYLLSGNSLLGICLWPLETLPLVIAVSCRELVPQPVYLIHYKYALL